MSEYAIILDRDDTVNVDPGYLSDINQVELLPRVAEAVALFSQSGISVFIASNQSGVARGLITNEQLKQINEKIVQLIALQGGQIEKVYVCPHKDEDECECRKPKSGLIEQIIRENNLSPEKIYLIGDRGRDLSCGVRWNMKGILVGNREHEDAPNCVHRAENLFEAASFVLEDIFEIEIQKKIFLSAHDFLPRLKTLREKKQRIITTNGCFDILHSGHAQLLSQARALGDALIVGLNSDRSVRALKGEKRPVNSQVDRARMLALWPFVSAVIIFDEDTPLEMLKILQPDIHVKGGDYQKEQLPEYALMKTLGGDVTILPFRKGYSTTSIINKFLG